MKTILKKQATPYYFTFIADAEDVKKLIEEEYENIKHFIEADGFRKGHVPRKIAENNVTFDKFKMYRGVFDKLYIRAIEEKGLSVADAFDFEVKGPFEDNSPLCIRATIYLMPRVNEFDINKVEVSKKEKIEITSEDVENQIKILMNKSAKFVNVTDENYSLKNGDIIIINYMGKIDGKLFNGGSAKAFKYIIGETKFVPGFEEQLLKIVKRKEETIIVRFPEDYFSADLKGKQATFEVDILKIEQRLDISIEDFVKSQGFNSIDELKSFIEKTLYIDNEKIANETFEKNVLNACINQADIDAIPQVLINVDVDNQWNRLLYQIGMTEEKYLEKFPSAKASFYEQRIEKSEKELVVKTFLSYFAQQKSITVSDEEIDVFVTEQCEKLNKSEQEKQDLKDKLNLSFNERNKSAVIGSILDQKVIKFLVNYFL